MNQNADINGGIFLCIKAGYYQFAAGIGSAEFIGVSLKVNSKFKTYARYLMVFTSANLINCSVLIMDLLQLFHI